MEIEMEIISKEFIKPSSPTPDHLKTFNVSVFDQQCSHSYVPMLFFYPSTTHADDTSSRSNVLKKSLSENLALHYPLAGRKKDSSSVDCTDDGAYYICATTNLRLLDYLKCPNNLSFAKFMPEENVYGDVNVGDHLVMVQETRFSCGGIAIGVAVTHMISDITSMSCFVKSWSAIARDSNDDEKQAFIPDLTSISSQYPKNDIEDVDLTSLINVKISTAPVVTRRFVFDGLTISNLKSELKSPCVPSPESIEVVCAVLCRSMRTAMETNSKQKTSILAVTIVGLRQKAVPPFGDSCLGNLVWLTPFLLDDDQNDLLGFIREMRKAELTTNGDFVKSFQVEGRLEEALRELKKSCAVPSTDRIVIANACNLGLYEWADFGWGKPLWIPNVSASKPFPFPAIKMFDGKHDNGIDAWVTLDEDAMTLMENDIQLLSLADLDPSPLPITEEN